MFPALWNDAHHRWAALKPFVVTLCFKCQMLLAGRGAPWEICFVLFFFVKRKIFTIDSIKEMPFCFESQ